MQYGAVIRAFSVGFLGMLGGLFALGLLAATVTAQQIAPPEPVIPGPDAECPGAKVVNATTGTGPKQSPPFAITGTRFRITITNVATSQDPNLSGVSVWVNEADGDSVTTFSQEGPGTDSSIVNAGPGQFFIETNPANSRYAVVVEDCVDTADGSNGGAEPAVAPERVAALVTVQMIFNTAQEARK